MMRERLNQQLAWEAEPLERLQDAIPPELRLLQAGRLSLFDGHPWLFREAFPEVPDEAIHRLSLAMRLLLRPLIRARQLASGTERSPDPGLIHGLLLRYQVEAHCLLSGLFEPASGFWSTYRELAAAEAGALLARQEYTEGRTSWRHYDVPVAEGMARALSSLAELSIVGLGALSGGQGPILELRATVSDFSLACELLQGVDGWWEDLRQAVPRCVLAGQLETRPPIEDAAAMRALRLELEQRLASGGLERERLTRALDLCCHVERTLSQLPEMPWRQVNRAYLEACLARLERRGDLIAVRSLEAESGVHLLAPRQELAGGPAVAWRGLRRLCREWGEGFREACHEMPFPREQGFIGQPELQRGDVFQRALIVDTLLDAERAFALDLRPLVDRELDYLLGQRRAHGVGGWSYFPQLPELPPDADDLAQVMQALLRRGRRAELKATCELPLSTLLSTSSLSEGRFETWILPRERDALQALQQRWIDLAWGAGADVEVLANLLYALLLYDAGRYEAELREGTAFLVGRQQPEGSWSSTWYHGPFYGTWVCLRVLSRTTPKAASVERALRFLWERQRSDGGWGGGERGDPLSTACALLGLAELRAVSQLEPARVAAGLKALVNMQDTAGAWPAAPFIRMDLGRPTGRILQTLTYGSSTITTSFAVKALLAWLKEKSEACTFNLSRTPSCTSCGRRATSPGRTTSRPRPWMNWSGSRIAR